MTDNTQIHMFMAVAHGLLDHMKANCADLDYSENDYAPNFVLLRIDENTFDDFRLNVLYPACVETGLSPLAMMIRIAIPAEGSHDVVIAAGSSYNEFCHNYVWEELKRRNAVDQMEHSLEVGQMLQSLVGALMGDMDDGDSGPCDDPNCVFCHPQSDIPCESPTPDSFFINPSKTVH